MRTPETRSLRALVFDFDHTLTDFGRGVDWQAARAEILALYSRVGVEAASLRPHGPFSLFAALDEAVSERHSRARAHEVRSEAFHILTTYECAGAERASLLPGAANALVAVTTAGLGLGIVSGNAESAIRLVLARLDLEDRFAAVVGRAPQRPLKPAPDMHREALRLLGCAADAALGIGDSVGDMRAAAAAGMLSVGVAGGEGTPAELFAAGACYVLADLTALPPLLALWARAVEA
jgi:HAD superfamily hydrolase (TIGR01509 family)